VVLLLLDDGEHARWRFASCGTGRHRRAQDPSLGVVESDLLAPDRHDRHDRFACLARRRCLGGWRGSGLSRRRVGSQRRQCGHRRERHNGGSPPTPRRHGGLCRHESIYQCHVPLQRRSTNVHLLRMATHPSIGGRAGLGIAQGPLKMNPMRQVLDEVAKEVLILAWAIKDGFSGGRGVRAAAATGSSSRGTSRAKLPG
jgi:hypothetical protein